MKIMLDKEPLNLYYISMSNKQTFKNDCSGCKFLMHENGHDYYFHEMGFRGAELIAVNEKGYKKITLRNVFSEVLRNPLIKD